MKLVLFLGYFTYLTFFSRGVIVILNKNLKNSFPLDEDTIFGVKIFYFYPLISLFLLGNISFIFNFFFPSNILIILFLSPILIANFFKKIDMKFDSIELLILSVSLFACFIGVQNLGFHYDAGLYHLNSQNFINSQKIIIGHVNLFFQYGFSSIMEYLGSVHWFANNLILLSFIQVPFFILLFNIIYTFLINPESTRIKFSSICTLLYLFIDNFGYGGGGNGSPQFQGVGKFDSASSILQLVCIILFLKSLESGINDNELRFYLVLVLFAIQIKTTNLPLLILVFSLIINKLKNKYFLEFIKDNLLVIFISLFWMIKNLIISGCLFFPVKFTCFNSLVWSSSDEAARASKKIFDYFKITNFEVDLNIKIFVNFFGFLLLLLLYELIKNKSLTTIFAINKWILLYFLINIFMYIKFTPTLRFFGGVLISIISTYSFFMKQSIFYKKNFRNIILFPLMIFSIFLIPRLSQYNFSELSSLNNYKLTSPEISYDQLNSNALVIPSKGEQCWINLKCIPYDDEIKIRVTNLNYLVYLK